MMRSLNSAVAGLRTHQTKMDVIGNNIANVNTYGFKSSRVTFNDIFYQTMNAASAPVYGQRGGTNPTQIGYGSAVATIDVLNTQAGATSTDRAMDVYITGDGFLVTTNARGDLMYTRLGNLGFDAEGNLIDPNGNFVMGWPMTSLDDDGNAAPTIPGSGTTYDAIAPINVSPGLLDKLTGISISTSGEIVGVLEGGTTVSFTAAAGGLNWLTGVTIPEDTTLTGSISLISGAWISGADLTALLDGSGSGPDILNGITINDVEFGGEIVFDPYEDFSFWVSNGTLFMSGSYTDENNVLQTITVSGSIDSKGRITLSDDTGKKAFILHTDAMDAPIKTLASITTGPGSGSGTAAYVVDGIANGGSDFDYYMQLVGTDKGGNKVTSGNPKPATAGGGDIGLDSGGFRLDYDDPDTGSSFRVYAGKVADIGSDNVSRVTLGAIVLAKFRNAAGLEEIGNSQFMATANSGEALYVRPGLEGTGGLLANYLELSNVDISKEFTDMITTQRGFQANTRIITVSDEMLAELVNLKR